MKKMNRTSGSMLNKIIFLLALANIVMAFYFTVPRLVQAQHRINTKNELVEKKGAVRDSIQFNDDQTKATYKVPYDEAIYSATLRKDGSVASVTQPREYSRRWPRP